MGRRGLTPLGGYCASKFALIGLTEAPRMELHGKPVHVGLVLPDVVETSMVEQVSRDGEVLDFWPSNLNMPPSWVVWAVFAVVRFHLLEISVPPGAATLEKLAALAPGVAEPSPNGSSRPRTGGRRPSAASAVDAHGQGRAG